MEKFLNNIWYSSFNLFSFLLLPISLIYLFVISLRSYLYQLGIFKINKFNIPIIIVGNISIGGSGKTPFCIWLAKYLMSKNLEVGIISSGYKGSSVKPIIVKKNSDPLLVGDESLLLFEKTQAKVVSSGNRVKATEYLINSFQVDVIIHDDGIQHYALARDYEIILVDNNKLFGNGFLLPSGPLREPKSRLKKANITARTNINNDDIYSVRSENQGVRNILTNEVKSLNDFKDKEIHLVTGIASIENITAELDNHKINYTSHKYNDHYKFTGNEFNSLNNAPIFLTSKDYVKLHKLDNKNIWVLLHEVVPNDLFIKKINKDLSKILKYEN
ncbi:MAG: tetraacyldisaccharide 4'-kinase [Gammaproteobacteria bacterium]|jgi:tetraacyldisaccharide 4'-kinase|nr:tetraacyldisaccharide 4'-kinase [Gammaproteobacteria bacterium]MBT4462105.1 tetraacyldisaccharide 4'-kinase [Gammaproteobacteria bacterium]MBT4654964.1 tetraacyldisaccharide 4'-kinase [Gammaproteobacteria bacterium]MBT5116522.1 tetraacyldisaccharide 4'-kinase [Gammaproteobacteria bacterium]MBT5761551.1 tetraacyldisaccharide 4'-kinase [Gammaproteobacteria bacterium]